MGQAGLIEAWRAVFCPAPAVNMAEDDFIDLSRVDAGLFQQGADHGGAQFDCRHIGQREPRKLPMAVRVAATMTTSCMTDSNKKRYAGA